MFTKNITIGELTDSIINKDYSTNPFSPLRQPPYIQQFRPESELWKMNRRLSQKDAMSSQQTQPAQQLPPPPSSHSQSKPPPNSKMVRF